MSWRRFVAKGVFWRQLINWGIRNVPPWLQPAMMATWALIFVVWGPGRRGIMTNLKAIKPGSAAIANLFRSFRVYWNFAWTMSDSLRFRELREVPDWTFFELKNFEKIQTGGGAVLLTAHMGNSDLGAHIFSEVSGRRIVMVRAPEVEPQTREFEMKRGRDAVRVEFNTAAADLAFELLQQLRAGELVAIQGDRVTEGIATLPATLFGRSTHVPAGPFALAMAAQVPIYPIFVVRRGYRSYGLITGEPINVVRTSNRDQAMEEAAASWTRELETVIGKFWFQWFAFEPFAAEGSA